MIMRLAHRQSFVCLSIDSGTRETRHAIAILVCGSRARRASTRRSSALTHRNVQHPCHVVGCAKITVAAFRARAMLAPADASVDGARAARPSTSVQDAAPVAASTRVPGTPTASRPRAARSLL